MRLQVSDRTGGRRVHALKACGEIRRKAETLDGGLMARQVEGSDQPLIGADTLGDTASRLWVPRLCRTPKPEPVGVGNHEDAIRSSVNAGLLLKDDHELAQAVIPDRQEGGEGVPAGGEQRSGVEFRRIAAAKGKMLAAVLGLLPPPLPPVHDAEPVHQRGLLVTGPAPVVHRRLPRGDLPQGLDASSDRKAGMVLQQQVADCVLLADGPSLESLEPGMSYCQIVVD